MKNESGKQNKSCNGVAKDNDMYKQIQFESTGKE